MITIKDVTDYLEGIAPLSLQESYDNSGLIVGSSDEIVKGIMICLDSTEDVVEDAKKNNCNLIIAHHPIIFSGLKKINGKNFVEKTIISAIKNDVAIYAIHTNLDNIKEGVNNMICRKLNLKNLKILAPKLNVLKKLVVFCPLEYTEKLRAALFEAGGGHIGNYENCSFNLQGEGTFKGNENSNPVVGQKGQLQIEKENRIEIVVEGHKISKVLGAMFQNHPYEEIAYDIYSLDNQYQNIGSGMIGDLPENQSEIEFLEFVKTSMKTEVIRHSPLLGKKVQKVAVCGGSGSFLLGDAIKSGAQVFITADFKYHQFFDANKEIVIADIGHFESEQFTMELIKTLILEKFSTFAVRFTEIKTNPVHYL